MMIKTNWTGKAVTSAASHAPGTSGRPTPLAASYDTTRVPAAQTTTAFPVIDVVTPRMQTVAGGVPPRGVPR
jgi:hypothetical protein